MRICKQQVYVVESHGCLVEHITASMTITVSAFSVNDVN
jgi:hypothetical protein